MNRKIWQSQNFLRRPEFVSSLVEKTDIQENDTVVEIGPGRGAITDVLSNKGCRVIGIEIDPSLAERLIEKYSAYRNVDIVNADFLRWNLPTIPYKIFSNIPFNMTSDIIRRITEANNPPRSTYLIMQDRAAERFIGRPVAPETQVSITLKPWFETAIVAKIDRNEFSPIPNINAVLAQFIWREKPLVPISARQQFKDFVIFGYNQWAPTVLDAFETVFSNTQRKIIARDLHVEGKKPSELSIQEWIHIFNVFSSLVPEDKRMIVFGAEQRLKRQQSKLQKMNRTRKR